MWEEPGQPCRIHFIQCTLLLVEKAGVAPVVTFRITARKQERVQARDPHWLWNPWGRTHLQARKSAGERSTLALKPMRKDTWSPKQEQSMAPQNGHLSNKKFKKKKKKDLFTPSKSESENFLWCLSLVLCLIFCLSFDFFSLSLLFALGVNCPLNLSWS